MAIAKAIFGVPTKAAEKRLWIIMQLRLKGETLRSIAREEGVSHQAVSGALSRPSARLEQVIASKLGIPVDALFPERYAEVNGARLHTTRPDNRNPANAPRRQKTA